MPPQGLGVAAAGFGDRRRRVEVRRRKCSVDGVLFAFKATQPYGMPRQVSSPARYTSSVDKVMIESSIPS
jgi:hypothetical protein